MVFINLWSAHMDESVWPEANTFNPERHLQNGGQTKSPSSPHVLTFGLGSYYFFLFQFKFQFFFNL